MWFETIRFSLVVWILPLIGFIYLFICLFHLAINAGAAVLSGNTRFWMGWTSSWMNNYGKMIEMGHSIWMNWESRRIGRILVQVWVKISWRLLRRNTRDRWLQVLKDTIRRWDEQTRSQSNIWVGMENMDLRLWNRTMSCGFFIVFWIHTNHPVYFIKIPF